MPYVSCAKLEAELAEKQDNLVDRTGAEIPGGTCVITCPTTAGTDGQVLTVQPDGSFAWEFPSISHDTTMTGVGTPTDPLSVVQATETQRGAVELATTAEAAAGTSTTTAVTPAGLEAALSDAFVNAAGAAIPTGSCLLTCPTTAGTDGQVLTVQADGTAAWESLGPEVFTVTHNNSLTGDGTAGNPLAVVPFVNGAAASVAPGACVITCPSTAGTAGQFLQVNADGSSSWATPVSFSLVDCNGASVPAGTAVATCANLSAQVPLGGTDGQVLTKQADGSNAWETASGGSTYTPGADGTGVVVGVSTVGSAPTTTGEWATADFGVATFARVGGVSGGWRLGNPIIDITLPWYIRHNTGVWQTIPSGGIAVLPEGTYPTQIWGSFNSGV